MKTNAELALTPAASLNWDDLRIALAVADGGSLAGAGRLLKVQHSTVLRRIDALETRLGTRLFDRHRQGYSTTDAGELLVEQARQMRSAIDEVRRRIAGRDLQLSGTVRLNTAYIAMLYLLPQALASFARMQPRIEVEVIESSALADLSRREADLALRISSHVPEHLVGRRIGDVRLRVYARRGADGLPQRPAPLATLVDHAPWIGFERDQRARFFDRWMADTVPADRIRVRVDLFHSMVAMLRTGIGVGLLPSFVEPHEPELVAVSDPIDALTTPLWLLTHADLRRTARVRAFMQHVGDALSLQLSHSSQP